MRRSRTLAFLVLLQLSAGCSAAPAALDAPTAFPGEHPRSPSPSAAAALLSIGAGACTGDNVAAPDPAWVLYDPDPQHLWNRLTRILFRRVAGDGAEHGRDSLDPLLWPETTHLLDGPSHADAIAVLDEFLASGGEAAVAEPARRALLQRDLWAAFDWTAARADSFSNQRAALQARLRQAIDRLSLPRREIVSLPDSLQATIQSGAFAAAFQSDSRSAFLPPGLGHESDGWVLLGRDGGPLAMSHTESSPFFGRSVFLVYLKAPGGRANTQSLVERLNARDARALATEDVTDVEVALVRRAVLLARGGEMVLSPIVESVQVRHFSPRQNFFQFELDRAGYVERGVALCPADDEFPLFFSHGVDPFEAGFEGRVRIPELCSGCHSGSEVAGLQSILSFSRLRFDLPGAELPRLRETTPEQEAQAVIAWKLGHPSWQLLASLPSDEGG